MYSIGGWITMPGVLQQRIQVAAFRRRREQTLERIGREQHEQQKADAHEPHDGQHARRYFERQIAAENRDRERPAREHQRPQQERAFVRSPRGGKPVHRGQLRVRVLRHVEHGEIIGEKRIGQTAERKRDEHQLPLRNRARKRHQRGVAGFAAEARARERQHPQDDRQDERQDQREMTEFRNHG
jgi:hypothetical protein